MAQVTVQAGAGSIFYTLLRLRELDLEIAG
jgi:hypothetical protein